MLHLVLHTFFRRQATANGRLTDSGRLQYTTKADNAPGSTAQKQDMVQTPTSAPTEVWETLAPTRSPRIQRVKASGPLPAPFNWKRCVFLTNTHPQLGCNLSLTYFVYYTNALTNAESVENHVVLRMQSALLVIALYAKLEQTAHY